MNRNTIEKILNFLKTKEGKEIPNKWELIKELENHPDDKQYIYEGNLVLNDSNIRKLPNDLYVRGYLKLNNSKQLIKLPDKLHVGYIFSLSYTNISELPNNLYVDGDLYINNTPLADKYTDEEITEMITSKGGTLIGKIYR